LTSPQAWFRNGGRFTLGVGLTRGLAKNSGIFAKN
jgi:hypothetical protein